MMSQQQIQRLLQSLNIPGKSVQADELSQALDEAGIPLPRETWAKRAKSGLKRPQLAGKYSHPPKKPLKLPGLPCEAMGGKREESLLDSDHAIHHSAKVIT